MKMSSGDPWLVYILCCADGSACTGNTNDVKRRTPFAFSFVSLSKRTKRPIFAVSDEPFHPWVVLCDRNRQVSSQR